MRYSILLTHVKKKYVMAFPAPRSGYIPRSDAATAMMARSTRACPISTLKPLCAKGRAFSRAAARASSAGGQQRSHPGGIVRAGVTVREATQPLAIGYRQPQRYAEGAS